MRALLLILLLIPLLCGLPLSAVIVDRIAVTAGDRIITASEIDLRIRLTAFQNNRKPQFDLASRRIAVERLIDQKLVEREMDVGHYPRLTGDRSRLLADYTAANYRSDAEAFRRALMNDGLTEDDLAEDLGNQADLLTFLSLRFRPAVQVNDDEVRRYMASKGLAEELRAQIEEKLVNDHADAEMDTWLRDQRNRAKIRYLDKDLAP